jgi:hypothetical protein
MDAWHRCFLRPFLACGAIVPRRCFLPLVKLVATYHSKFIVCLFVYFCMYSSDAKRETARERERERDHGKSFTERQQVYHFSFPYRREHGTLRMRVDTLEGC